MPNYEDYLKSLDYKYNNAEEIINNRIAGLEKNIEELSQNVNRLTNSEKRLKTDIENADKSIKEKNLIIKGQKETIDNLENKRQHNEKEIKNLSNKITTLDRNLVQLKTDGEQNTSKQKLEISRLLSEQSILQNENNDLNNQLVEAKRNYDKLFKDIGKTSDSANQLQKQINQLQQEKEKRNKEYHSIKKQYDEILKDISSTTNDATYLKNENKELQNKLSRLNKEKRELKHKLDDLKNGHSSEEFNRLKNEKEEIANKYKAQSKVYKEKEESLNNQVEKEQTTLKNYKSSIKTNLWILGIACLCFLGGMIYNVSEKESWKSSSEYNSDRYYELDDLIDDFSENSTQPYAIGEIDFYNSYTDTYDTIFKNSEVTFVAPRIKNLYSLKSDSIEISYKEYNPSGMIVRHSGGLKNGIKHGNVVFENLYISRSNHSDEIIGSTWGYSENGKWEIGKYRYDIYINDVFVKKAYLTITND